jgi:hypothetical protein
VVSGRRQLSEGGKPSRSQVRKKSAPDSSSRSRCWFVIVTIAKGVRIVPQGEEWIVERLGKYHGTLKPGLNIVIPYLDKVAYSW